LTSMITSFQSSSSSSLESSSSSYASYNSIPTTTLCRIKLTSMQDEMRLCIGNLTNCGNPQCLDMTTDYFGYWKYSGFNVYANMTGDRVLWLGSFTFFLIMTFLFIGIIVLSVYYVVIRRWKR
jgi:hypothetical protein